MAKKIANADLIDDDFLVDPLRKAQEFLLLVKEIEISVAKSLKSQGKLLKEFQKIGGLDEYRKVKRAIEDVNQATIEMLKLKVQEKKLMAQLETSKTDQAKTNEKLKQQINEINKATREQIKNEQALDKVLKTEVKTIQQLQERNNALIRTRKNLDLTTKEGVRDYQKLTAEVKKNNAELKKHDAAVGTYTRNVGNYGSALRGFGSQLLGILGAGSFVAIAQNAVEINAKFGQSLADLKAITGATDEQMQFFERTALNQTKTLEGSTASATEYTEALKLIASAKPELLENASALDLMTKKALLLSDASGLDLPESATKLTDAMNQFGASADQAGKFVDVLAAGAKYGSAEIPQITDALLEFGPVAKSYNVSIQESTAAIEGLAEKGIKGSEAGTKLRNVLLALGAAKGLPKEAQESFERVGIDVNVLSDNSLTLEERLTELSKAQNDEVAMLKIFGKENISAAKTVLSQKDRIAELTKKVDENGVAQEQAAIRTNTLSGEMKKLGNAWQTAMIEFGKGGGDLKNIIRFIRENLETIITVVTKIVKGFIVYKGTIMAVNLAMKAGKVASAAYASAMVAFGRSTEGAAKSFKALDSTMKANVIGLVVTAVYELADALGFFETEADRVAKTMDEINEEGAKTDESLGKRQEVLSKNIELLNQSKNEELAIAQAKGEGVDKINKKFNIKLKNELEREREFLWNARQKEKEDFKKFEEEYNKVKDKVYISAGGGPAAEAERNEIIKNRKVAYDNFKKYSEQIGVVEEQLAQNRSNARIEEAQTLGEQTNTANVASKEQIEAAKRKAEEIKRIESDLKKWLEDLMVSNIDTDREREIAEQELAFKRQNEQLQEKLKTLGTTSEEARQIEEQLQISHRQKLEKINEKYDEQELNAAIDDLNFRYKIMEEEATRTIKSQEKLDATLLDLEIKRLSTEIEILKGNGVAKEKIIDKQIELDNLLRKQTEENTENILSTTASREEAWGIIMRQMYDDQLKAAEKAQERIKDLIGAAQILADELTDILTEASQKREAILDKEIENSQRRQEELKAVAEQGVLEVNESLGAEERKQAELEKQKAAEQKRQQRIELANTAFKAYVGHVDNKDQSPLTSTIRDITALTAFIASLPAFFEGTENTGVGGNLDDKGGFLSVLHPRERVMTEDQNEKLGGLSNDEVAKIVQESRYNVKSHGVDAVNNVKMADKLAMDLQWKTNEQILEKLDEIVAVSGNRTETNWKVDEIAGAIIKQVKKGNDIMNTHYKLPNING